MRSIWRFPLELDERMTVRMPAGARILHAAVNAAGVPCLWAEVDTEAPLRDRRMTCVGTGGWLPDGRGPHIATFLTDVDGDEYVFHLYDEPRHDPVTGLQAREAFAQLLAGLPVGSGPVSVVIMALDDFPRVVEEFGDHAGQSLLMETASRVRSVLGGRADGEAARVGEDEFAVLLAGVGLERGRAVAETLLAELALPHALGDGITVSYSAGVATFWAGLPAEPAYQAAEEALAEARAAGGGQVAARWRP
jgi:diguanylate cyclase (GGDEF)-like protein